MKNYHGWINGDGMVKVTVGEGDRGHPEDLSPRRDIYDHSPDGFSWGYGGSGPAQLALALTADVLQDDNRATRLYQSLKRTFVAGIDGEHSWSISESALLAVLRAATGEQIAGHVTQEKIPEVDFASEHDEIGVEIEIPIPDRNRV